MSPEMLFDEETLMAYADGELDASTRAAIEAAMVTDVGVARRIAVHRELRTRLGNVFAPVLQEPVPERLLASIQKPTDSMATAKVTVLDDARKARLESVSRRAWSWPEWGSIAASLLVGIAVSRLFVPSAPVVMRDGELYARGTLASSLSEQLASTQTDTAPVRIGISFRNRSGEYCRTFQTNAATSLAGLACQRDTGWRVQMLIESAAPATPGENYRTAAASLPPVILKAVEDAMDGEALDAEDEALAIGSRWKK